MNYKYNLSYIPEVAMLSYMYVIQPYVYIVLAAMRSNAYLNKHRLFYFVQCFFIRVIFFLIDASSRDNCIINDNDNIKQEISKR